MGGCSSLCTLNLLLYIKFTLFHPSSVSIDMGLPSGSADVFDAARSAVVEDLLNLLKGLLARLWEHEENVDKHSGKEHSKKDVNLPANVNKRGWDEV